MIDKKAVRRERTCSSKSKACPGDIFYTDFVDGRPAFFDVTVRNTVQTKYVSEAAEMAGAAASAEELESDFKHKKSVLKCGGLLYPQGLECLVFRLKQVFRR